MGVFSPESIELRNTTSLFNVPLLSNQEAWPSWSPRLPSIRRRLGETEEAEWITVFTEERRSPSSSEKLSDKSWTPLDNRFSLDFGGSINRCLVSVLGTSESSGVWFCRSLSGMGLSLFNTRLFLSPTGLDCGLCTTESLMDLCLSSGKCTGVLP